MSDLYQFLYMYGGGSVRLWQRCDTFTSGFVACGWPGLGDAKKSYTQGISTGGSADLTARRIFRLTHQRAAPDRGRSLVYTNALLVGRLQAIDVWMIICLVFVFASLIEYAVVNVVARHQIRVKPPAPPPPPPPVTYRTLRGRPITAPPGALQVYRRQCHLGRVAGNTDTVRSHMACEFS